MYSYVPGLQSPLRMTFSSVPDAAKDYLKVDDATLDLFLNFGPVAYCISVVLAAWPLGSSLHARTAFDSPYG